MNLDDLIDSRLAALKTKASEPERALATAKADAWDEGFDAGYADQRFRDTGKAMPTNPYRQEETK